ncbi:MAG: UDP-N-acetylglucosamine 2-epimerase (non-hydrolyzing) [Magnetococcales bacterium]|nr:UDP-N-acetylglucosamine 2-epimerase (non-hydrolyzing) [Magnetococcales bacterium]
MASPLILCVVGARPNFMKMAAILPALREAGLATALIHTGQHYDFAMNQSFFQQLALPLPDEDLGVGSGSHAVQTAEIMKRFEPVLTQRRPALTLVVGDVNSTLACALTSVKMGIPTAHVEAGLRSFDRSMPEEINRLLTDQIAALLFTTERQAALHLAREGIDATQVHFVGNVMIDTLRRLLPSAPIPAEALRRLLRDTPDQAEAAVETPWRGYGVATLHRPSNVDDPSVLRGLLEVLAELAQRLPIIAPLHPRTRKRMEAHGLEHFFSVPGLWITGPAGYLEMLGLLAGAKLALTDSGGVQEETTALGTPCLTLRPNTERPVTVDEGTNTLVGSDPQRVRAAAEEILLSGGKAGRIPELWDGQAAPRIAQVIRDWV